MNAVVGAVTFGQGALAIDFAEMTGTEVAAVLLKTWAVDAVADVSAYTVGYACDELGMPAEVTFLASLATGCTVSVKAGKYVFQDANSNIVKELDADEMQTFLKELDVDLDDFDDARRVDEIKVEFNYNSKYDEAEFVRQLADQQKGMNELTVQEYLDNRQKYIEQGRAIESNAVQQAAREKAFVDKVDELQDAGLSLKEAEEQAQKWLNTQAALHNPDQVAGGHASNIGGVGDKGVNSSIGSQWRYRIDDIDAQIKKMAESMSEADRISTYLNVNLTYKGE